MVRSAFGLRKAGGDGTIDMATAGAQLALRGGSSDVDTLSEFYDLTGSSLNTNAFSGDDFRYWDGSSWTNFDNMTGTDWFELSYDSNYLGSGQGYTVLTTIPEPTSIALLLGGLIGLLAFRRR